MLLHCLFIRDFLFDVIALVVIVVFNIRIGALKVRLTHHVGRAERADMGWRTCRARSEIEVRGLDSVAQLRALTPVVNGVDATVITRDILIKYR